MHSTAFGKAILSHLPRERVDEIIDQHGLPKVTSQTITSRDELYKELNRTRDRGFAVDDEERLEGLRCIAAPIRFDSDVIGAISVSGPTVRIDDDWESNDFVSELRRAVNVIELNKYNVWRADSRGSFQQLVFVREFAGGAAVRPDSIDSARRCAEIGSPDDCGSNPATPDPPKRVREWERV